MPRSWSFALVCALFLPLRAASAEPTPTALAPHSLYGERGEAAAYHQRNAGAIEGRVVAVDYKSGMITLHTGKGPVVVVVLPSTSIQAEKSGFHTIADIVKGERVHVLVSQRGEHFIAQIINIKN